MPHVVEDILRHSGNDLINSILEPYRAILNDLDEVYIFGAGKTGANVARNLARAGVKILGFIDNSPSLPMVGDLAVGSLSAVPNKDAVIVIGTGFQFEIAQQLAQAGFPRHIPYQVLSLPEGLLPRDISLQDIEDLPSLKNELADLYEALADRKSRDTLEAVLRYRTSLEPMFLNRIKTDPSVQYFDREILGRRGEGGVFVDGGGYDGDSSRRFIDFSNGKYDQIFLFEPDARLCETAKSNLRSVRDITFRNVGLWSSETTRYFIETGDMNGFMVGSYCEGSTAIRCSPLDQEVASPVSFIKLDIEGAENEAIKGAARHITRERPVIAIAWDHSSRDLINVPRSIRSLNGEYRIHLRHYGDTVSETVAYFS